MKVLLTILVYNRFHNLQRWLYCWHKCNQIAELIILHTGDEQERYKAECDKHGVKYIHRENTTGRDIAVVQDVFRERIPEFPNDWDLLLWLTDDVMPMREDFITPFISKFNDRVGIVAMQISKMHAVHVRTTAYCIKKEVANKIQFPADPVTTREQGLYWEHRGRMNTLTVQVCRMGLECVEAEPILTGPLWDTGYGKRPERLVEHRAAFPEIKNITMIHHFYHIYADGSWMDPVYEHVLALKMGLLERLDTFNIGIVGKPLNRARVKQYLVEQGIAFNIIAEADNGWEQTTMIPMWEFSKTNDGVMLYAHTKGSSDPSHVNIRWRRSMIWCHIVNYLECLKQLETHQMVGCHFIHPVLMPEHVFGNWMFAGTFWWGHCDLIRKFPQPKLTTRHESEAWIGYYYEIEKFSVYDFTPYWPNTNTFADGWINNPDYIPELTPVSIPAP